MDGLGGVVAFGMHYSGAGAQALDTTGVNHTVVAGGVIVGQ
jgi:hypothetical protein